MLLLYSQIIGANIISLEKKSRAGIIKEVVYKDDFQIAGLLIRTPMFSPRKVLTSVDILGIERPNVFVRNEESIVNLEEIPMIVRCIGEGLWGIGQTIKTESNKKIGTIYDFTIDSESLQIPSFYVRDMMNDKIISTKAIIDYKKRVFIIQDEFSKMKMSVLQSSASLAK